MPSKHRNPGAQPQTTANAIPPKPKVRLQSDQPEPANTAGEPEAMARVLEQAATFADCEGTRGIDARDSTRTPIRHNSPSAVQLCAVSHIMRALRKTDFPTTRVADIFSTCRPGNSQRRHPAILERRPGTTARGSPPTLPAGRPPPASGSRNAGTSAGHPCQELQKPCSTLNSKN